MGAVGGQILQHPPDAVALCFAGTVVPSGQLAGFSRKQSGTARPEEIVFISASLSFSLYLPRGMYNSEREPKAGVN